MAVSRTMAAIPIVFYSYCFIIGVVLVIIGHVRLSDEGEAATCTCISAFITTVRSSNSGSARTSTSKTRECSAKVSVELASGGSKGSKDYIASSLLNTDKALPDGCSCGEPFSCWFASGSAWKSESAAENSFAATLVIGYAMICISCVAIAIALILVLRNSDGDGHEYTGAHNGYQDHMGMQYPQHQEGSGYPSTPHFAVGQPCGPPQQQNY